MEVEEEEDGDATVVGENHFKRLPDDLIVHHIFDKMSEAKSLCRCSLVSKHFCSLVYQTHNIFFKLPVPIPLPDEPQNALPDSSGVFLLTANFLRKFTSLKSLHLEVDYSCYPIRPDQPAKWRLILGVQFSRFVALVARTIHSTIDVGDNNIVANDADEADESEEDDKDKMGAEETDNDEEDDRHDNTVDEGEEGDGDYDDIVDINIIDEDEEDDGNDNVVADIADVSEEEGMIRRCLADSQTRWSLFENVLPALSEKLENIVITDTKKLGRFDIDLIEVRNPRMATSDKPLQGGMKLFKPVLELPLSGFVMKTVLLLIVKFGEDVDDYSIAKEYFEGEDKIYVEAAMEMLKKGVLVHKE